MPDSASNPDLPISNRDRKKKKITRQLTQSETVENGLDLVFCFSPNRDCTMTWTDLNAKKRMNLSSSFLSCGDSFIVDMLTGTGLHPRQLRHDARSVIFPFFFSLDLWCFKSPSRDASRRVTDGSVAPASDTNNVNKAGGVDSSICGTVAAAPLRD